MEKRIKLSEVYAIMARTLSMRSTCKRQQNGAVIVSLDYRRVLSIGYNGTPHGDEHCKGGKPGDCGCIHAEMNALLKKYTSESAVMFMTTSPCMNCAKAIVQCNIISVYYINEYRLTNPIVYLKLKDIDIQQIKIPKINVQS